MKQLLFILSIFLTAGCTGSKDKPVKTDLLSTLPPVRPIRKVVRRFLHRGSRESHDPLCLSQRLGGSYPCGG